MTHPAAFGGSPGRRRLVDRSFCFWQDGARAFGTIVWGRPDDEDVRAMARVFEVGGDARFEGHASIVDVRAVEAVDVTAFEELHRYLCARAPAWASNVRRQALLHEGGFVGALVVGALKLAGLRHPVEPFEGDAAAAFAWCGLSDLLDSVESLRASVLDEPEVVRRVREALGAGASSSPRELAARLGTSARSLQRRLEEAGTSLREQRRAHLGREIERLLAGTDLDLEAIAAQVGLRSSSHLVRVFRARRGVSPGRWRATQRAGHRPRPG